MAHHQPLDEEFSSRVLDSVQRNFLLPLLSRVTRGNTHTDGALGEVARGTAPAELQERDGGGGGAGPGASGMRRQWRP